MAVLQLETQLCGCGLLSGGPSVTVERMSLKISGLRREAGLSPEGHLYTGDGQRREATTDVTREGGVKRRKSV